MAADPEPRDLIVLKQPNRSVPESDAHRVDRFTGVNPLELQAGMVGVSRKRRYALRAVSLMGSGSSRYAAQKRGVAREFTGCPGRGPSSGQRYPLRALRRPILSAHLEWPQNAASTALRSP